MDVHSLAVVLQAALSPNPDERKAAEESLNQVNFLLYIYTYMCMYQYLIYFI